MGRRGFCRALIGLAGWLLGGLFGPRRNPPIIIGDFSDEAMEALSRTGLDRIEVTIVDPRMNWRVITREIRNLEKRDSVWRIPGSFG